MVKHCPWQRVVIQRRRPTVGVTGVVTGVYEDIVIRQAESSDALTCIAVPEEKFLRGRVEVTVADLKLCRSRPQVHYYGDTRTYKAQSYTKSYARRLRKRRCSPP